MSALRLHLRRLAKDSESGQAMVEFVIVFPVQIMITLTIIQFAYVAHAHIVVSQAAFLGARAAAVSDMQSVTLDQAGRRAAARMCALLTTGGSASLSTPTPVPTNGDLGWKNKDTVGTALQYGFDAKRQAEAYGLLTMPAGSTQQKDGYVVCDVIFDYVMQIPIGNHSLRLFSSKPGAATDQSGDRLITFRIRRVGFVATPWTKPPSAVK